MSASEKKTTNREQFLRRLQRCIEESREMRPEELKFRYRGILYPAALCSLETFKAMEAVEARNDDVLIATYPKCGTNWTVEILHEMLFGLHNREPTLHPFWLEFGKLGKYEDLDQAQSPRVIASHLACENIPKSFFERKAKILVILRNPKDTAVSFYHFMNNNPMSPNCESWEQFMEDYINGDVMYGSYFNYILGWEKHVDDENVLVLTFEDMKADPPAQLRKISDFCGLSLTEKQIELLQQKTTFASMKENSAATHGDAGKYLFRKGEIGDWKKLFTKEQSEAVDATFEKHLAGTKLGEMLNYSKYCTY
ncbi:sulfotransferase 6B1-like [Gastrophryne carolinensis]